MSEETDARRDALAEEVCKWRHPDLALGAASPVANHPDPRCRIAACFACQGVAALAMPLLAGWLADAWDEGYALDWTGGVRWTNPYRAEAPDA